MMFLKFKSPE